MPPARRRRGVQLSAYDRELLQAVNDRRLDRDDPEVQAVLQGRTSHQGLLSEIIRADEGEKLQESPSGQERKEVDPQKSELAKSLREYSRKYPRHDWVEPVKGLPLVPAPPSLGGTPFILGSDTARYVEQLRALNPRILERIGQITTGPNLAFIEQVIRANRSDVLGDRRNPLKKMGIPTGLFHNRRRSIYLDPYSSGQELFKTLAHELSHGAGTNEEAAYRIGDEALRFFSGDYGPISTLGDLINAGEKK